MDILSAFLLGALLLSLVINYVSWQILSQITRQDRRAENAWKAERDSLLDRIMLMKGFREYGPAPEVDIHTSTNLDEELESEYEEEGFRPY